MSVVLNNEPLGAVDAEPWTERAWQAVLTAGLALLGFFVLFSTAGTSIAMALLFALCLVAPGRIVRTRFWREPIFATGLVLLAYIALRSLAEPVAFTHAREINRYHELLFIPLLWALVRQARRPAAFAIGLAAGATYLAAMYWIFGSTDTRTMGMQLQLHRISAGFSLAVCAYVLFEMARLRELPRWLGFGAAALLAATVLLVIDARTGHLVLLLLAGCAAFRAAPPRARLVTTGLVLVAMVAFAALSPTVRQRAQETFHDTEAVERGQQVALSSTTVRIEILRTAISVAREHWAAGTGWAHYPDAVAEVARRRHADPTQVYGALSVNPHNEYLLQLAAGGIVSLLLFVAWLAAPVVHGVRASPTREPWSGAIACIALAFALGCLFNSLLLDFTEAHFYAALLAWLLGRQRSGD